MNMKSVFIILSFLTFVIKLSAQDINAVQVTTKYNDDGSCTFFIQY
jgi:hypothetical protein